MSCVPDLLQTLHRANSNGLLGDLYLRLVLLSPLRRVNTWRVVSVAFGLEPQTRIAKFLGNDLANIRKHKIIDGFVLEEFLRVVKDGDEHKYKLSIAIAELLFSFENDLSHLRRDLGATDSLAYPSLASESINANLAFRPEAFHRIYQPVGCE